MFEPNLKSESARYIKHRNKIRAEKKKLKQACSTCSSKELLCPDCESAFKQRRELMKANLPVAKTKIASGVLKDVAVYEYDFGIGKANTKLQLYEDLLNRYKDNMQVVVENGHSLFFVGENGCGKTVAAVNVAIHAIAQGLEVYYITFPELHSLHTSSFHNEDDLLLLHEIKEVDLLVVDELGKETSKTGSVMRLADTFIKSREENGLPTIIITNTKVSELRDKNNPNGYGASFWSMVSEKYRIFVFDPKLGDLRAQNRKKWEI